MKKIKNLLIDLDGTLVDFKEYRASLEFSLRFLKWWSPFVPPWRALRGLWRLNSSVTSVDKWSSNYTKGIHAFAFASGLPTEQVSLLMGQCLEDVFPSLEKYFFPVPGAREFVEWASHHYPLILATNPVWPSELVEMRLRWGGISARRFGSITHAKRMSSCKPSLDYYREIIQQEGLDPETCALIGNDLKSDGPAIGVGMQVFILSDLPQAEPIVKAKVVQVASAPDLLWTGNYQAIREVLERML